MPTLEDTAIDFPVTTLNDLLEVEAKAGVPASADEDKYRRWAFLSSGAAGLLAIVVVVLLITGGGDSGGGESKAQKVDPPAGTVPVPLSVAENKFDNPKAGEFFNVSSVVDGVTTQLVKAGMLTSIKKGAKLGPAQQLSVVMAVRQEEEQPLNAASATSLRFVKVEGPAPNQPAETTTTTASAAQTPAPPTPEAPAPEAPATTQPTG